MNVDQLNFLTGLGGDSDQHSRNTAQMEVKVRLGFMRKVYSILAVQLTFCAITSGVILFSEEIKMALFRNYWILFVNMAVGLISLIACLFMKKKYPINFVLLGIFTMSNSLSTGVLVSLYEKMIVFQAFVITAAMVIGLTIYTLTSKRDYSWLGFSLSVTTSILLALSVMQIFFQSPLLNIIYTVLGAVLFAFYIIYDTQMVMKHLSPEEYIVGAINLYMDIINLFIHILKLLNEAKKKDSRRERR